jgi:hypothetical protein
MAEIPRTPPIWAVVELTPLMSAAYSSGPAPVSWPNTELN